MDYSKDAPASKMAEELNANMEKRRLTFGENAIKSHTVDEETLRAIAASKRIYAAAIDEMNDLRTSSESPAVKRLCAATITQLEFIQMAATKAITWKD